MSFTDIMYEGEKGMEIVYIELPLGMEKIELDDVVFYNTLHIKESP